MEFTETFRTFDFTAVNERYLLAMILLCFCTGGFAVEVQAQTNRMSNTLILRSQAGSVAEETLAKLSPVSNGTEPIGLHVEGGSAHALLENAFLELLSRQGMHASLQSSPVSTKRVLQVLILEQGVRYSGLSSGEYHREVHTEIEAREQQGDTSSVRYLGKFSRVDVDTVAFREDSGLLPVAREGERNLLDKLIGPVLLIGGAFLVVYLFFTVRN